MQLCSYMLNCKEYKTELVPKSMNKVNIFYEQDGLLYSYFRVPNSPKYHIKLSYPLKRLEADKQKILFHLLTKFLLMTLLLLVVALLFTYYSLKPIRKALKINDEFIKDIVHDFNTPITSVVLNLEMLTQEEKKNPFIKRIAQGVDNILFLQNNLKDFLSLSPSMLKQVNVSKLAKERLDFMQNVYPKIDFTYQEESTLITASNAHFLIRILDNILTNAGKYNRPNGKVNLLISQNKIIITDTGKGIKDVKKVLERYHTEQSRGLGIGLHIVNKLTRELGIELSIKSKIGIGTEVTLVFKKED